MRKMCDESKKMRVNRGRICDELRVKGKINDESEGVVRRKEVSE